MAVKIWRHEVHAIKQNITLEAFIEQVQQEDGDVTSIRTLQTSTKGSVKRNTSSPQFMDNRESLSNSTTTATIVAVVFLPYPPPLNMPPITEEQAFQVLVEAQRAGGISPVNSSAILNP